LGAEPDQSNDESYKAVAHYVVIILLAAKVPLAAKAEIYLHS
jgi:hypothetical protein